MSRPEPFNPKPIKDTATDQVLQQQAHRLYKLTLQLRWISVVFLWLSIAPLSLWGLRHEIPLWLDYFTWTAVRYSLIYNPLSAFGLALCMWLTLSTAIWQSCNAIFGISPEYLHQLKKRVLKIRQQKQNSWLRKKICQAINHNLSEL